MGGTAIQPAFREPGREAQTVFRAVMNAMARPGSIQRLNAGFAPPSPLSPTAAAILLALADFETSIWLDTALGENPAVRDFLRFHTGAKLTDMPGAADFALIADGANPLPLTAFAQGLPDYPDRSTTIIFQVTILSQEGWQLAGPGIHGQTGFGASPLPRDFAAQLKDNQARFPLGADLIFARSGEIAAMPRSTRIVETG
jgi:alpha-D-ribose 1-methylphosphonate 5-triphosphate synthase subunit PhnH